MPMPSITARALISRYWGNGFLPSRHQAVRFRSEADLVLYLNNPPGIDAAARGDMLQTLTKLHQLAMADAADPFIEARIAQHEMAYRMQASIPEATDLSDEPESVLEMYGPDAKTPGTLAANCIQARRLAERGVRFIQLFHQAWDHHGGLPGQLPGKCKETDHHPRCFSMWMAGGGIAGGRVYGETDPFGYNITESPVHVHDLQATIMHALGIDQTRLTFKYQGRQFRLTGVHGEVIHDWFG
jgi:hypothetical protein